MQHKDQAGVTIQTPDNKPPVHGTPVRIITGNGSVAGTMVGGYAVKDK